MKKLLIATSALGLAFAFTTTSPAEAVSEPTAAPHGQQGKIILARGHHWRGGGVFGFLAAPYPYAYPYAYPDPYAYYPDYYPPIY